MKPKSHKESDSVIIAGQSKLVPVASGLDKPKYKLSDLLAECNQNTPIPPDLASWNIMPPVGVIEINSIDSFGTNILPRYVISY